MYAKALVYKALRHSQLAISQGSQTTVWPNSLTIVPSCSVTNVPHSWQVPAMLTIPAWLVRIPTVSIICCIFFSISLFFISEAYPMGLTATSLEGHFSMDFNVMYPTILMVCRNLTLAQARGPARAENPWYIRTFRVFQKALCIKGLRHSPNWRMSQASQMMPSISIRPISRQYSH